ncbi:MAG: T9SS type A sorting domain-containing protein [Sphingobacteriales bacterium]|nr:T9SS type A sorting domain-containing protein [Sphingobacteriales bacterium]
MAIRVYPTVSSNGIVNIALPTDSSPAKISVFDMSGKMVLQNVLPTSSSIELPNTAGNYIVQIETNALKVMRKVERY